MIRRLQDVVEYALEASSSTSYHTLRRAVEADEVPRIDGIAWELSSPLRVYLRVYSEVQGNILEPNLDD